MSSICVDEAAWGDGVFPFAFDVGPEGTQIRTSSGRLCYGLAAVTVESVNGPLRTVRSTRLFCFYDECVSGLRGTSSFAHSSLQAMKRLACRAAYSQSLRATCHGNGVYGVSLPVVHGLLTATAPPNRDSNFTHLD
jgi:hypothetical protein